VAYAGDVDHIAVAAPSQPVSSTPCRIGFVGAGQIGEPMVRRLLGAGHQVRLYARRPEVGERLGALGAGLVDSAPAVADGADAVITCLFSDEQLAAVAPEVLAAMPTGSVFVSHTTGTPGTIERLAELAWARQIGVVDAPFSGNAEGVLAGSLTVYLGGNGDVLARADAIVRAYADPVLPTGPRGSALRVKLLNNVLFASISQLTLGAIEAGRGMGVTEDALQDALRVSSGGSHAADYIRELGGAEAYTGRVAHFLRKDVEACRSVAADLGVNLGPLLRAAADGPIDVHLS
jgi:3-hydroxyisobutyrate dehydrogenase-like beta-hydroxyacid dehydrogenase